MKQFKQKYSKSQRLLLFVNLKISFLLLERVNTSFFLYNNKGFCLLFTDKQNPSVLYGAFQLICKDTLIACYNL